MSTEASAHGLWSATVATLGSQHPAVARALLRAAGVHWLDETMLAALDAVEPPAIDPVVARSAEPLPPDLVYVLVEGLPFIETYADKRVRLHVRIREVLLTELLARAPDFIAAVSQVVAEHLAERSAGDRLLDDDELLELAYHLLAVDADGSAEMIDRIHGDASVTPAVLDRLMQYVEELRSAGRLSGSTETKIHLWAIWTAAAVGDYRRVRRLAAEATAALGPDHDLAPQIAYEDAFACLQLGEREEAERKAIELAERHPSDRLGVMATMLLGDLAGMQEAFEHYAISLAKLTGLPEAESATCLQVGHWSVASATTESDEIAETTVAEEFPIVLLQSVQEEARWTHADSLFGHIWLRIGEADSGRGRFADARDWLRLAQDLFELLGDVAGYQSAAIAGQQLAARCGNTHDLREQVHAQYKLIQWARSAGAAQVELRALLDLAEAYNGLYEPAEAVGPYKDAAALAARLNDRSSQATAARGLAEAAVARRRFLEADEHLAVAEGLLRELDSYDAGLLALDVADRWLADRKPLQAKDAYLQVLDLARRHGQHDDEARARLGLALAALSMLDLAEARQQLEAAVGTADDSVLKLYIMAQYAQVLRQLRQDDVADGVEAQLAEQATDASLEPILADLMADRARTAERRFDLQAARSAFQQALGWYERLDNQSGRFGCLIGLAETASELGQHEDARAAAQAAAEIAEHADQPQWRSNAVQALATALVYAGDLAKAIELMLGEQQCDPQDAVICTHLGWIYLRIGDYDESLRWSRHALQLNPADLFPYRNIGHALLCLGRFDAAKDAYAEAIRGRFGDENFRNTLVELNFLRSRHPDLPGLDEVYELFQNEQATLDRR